MLVATFSVAIAFDIFHDWRSIIVEGVDRTIGLKKTQVHVHTAPQQPNTLHGSDLPSCNTKANHYKTVSK